MLSRLLQWNFSMVFFSLFFWWVFSFAGKCSYIDAKSAASNKTISNGCSHRRTERCRFSWCSHEIHLSRFRVTVGRFQCTSLAMARKSVRTIRCGFHYTCANLYESSVGANGPHSFVCSFFGVIAIKVIFVLVEICGERVCVWLIAAFMSSHCQQWTNTKYDYNFNLIYKLEMA